MPAAVENLNKSQALIFIEAPQCVDAFVSEHSQPVHKTVETTLDLLRACGRDDSDVANGSQDAGCDFVSLTLLSRMLHAESLPVENAANSTPNPGCTGASTGVGAADESLATCQGHSQVADEKGIPSATSVEMTADGKYAGAASSCLHFMVHRCGETPAEFPTLLVFSQLLCKSEIESNKEEIVDEVKVLQEVSDDKTKQWIGSPLNKQPVNQSKGSTEVNTQMMGVSDKEIAYSSMVPRAQVRRASAHVVPYISFPLPERDPSMQPVPEVKDMGSCAREAYTKRYLKRLYFGGPIIVGPSSKMRSLSPKLDAHYMKNEEMMRKKEPPRGSYLDPTLLHPYQAIQRQDFSLCSPSGRSTGYRGDPHFMKYFRDSSRQEMDSSSYRKRGNPLPVSPRCLLTDTRENTSLVRCYHNLIRSRSGGVPLPPHRPPSCSPSSHASDSLSDARFAQPSRVSSRILLHKPQEIARKLWSQQKYKPPPHQQLGTNLTKDSKKYNQNRNGSGLHMRNTNVTSPYNVAPDVTSVSTACNWVNHVQHVRDKFTTHARAPYQNNEPSSLGVDIINLMVEGRSICVPVRGPPASMVRSLRRI